MAASPLLDRFLGRFAAAPGAGEGPSFVEYCASRIQAAARGRAVRRGAPLELLRLSRWSVYQIAALEIQAAWREHRRSAIAAAGMGGHLDGGGSQHRLSRAGAPRDPREDAARRIQLAWRSAAAVKIYRYYRDLIRFAFAGNPRELLRAINPSEAGLFDAASGVHVRFRLGGSAFPPTIYYKIFTHRPVSDVGSFAPRAYTRASRPPARAAKDRGTPARAQEALLRVGRAEFRATVRDDRSGGAGWYVRRENNGWRAVATQGLEDAGAGPAAGDAEDAREQPFHWSRLQRTRDVRHARKERKRRWMQRLYSAGTAKEHGAAGAGGGPEERSFDGERAAGSAGDREGAGAEGGGGASPDLDGLLEWCEDLDYDAYIESWASLATSAPSGANVYAQSLPF